MPSDTQQDVTLEIESLESEDQDRESTPSNYQITTYPADFTLEVLHQKWRAGDIEVPDFQRNYVWKQSQASRLIESFLMGLPVPAVFLYNEQKSQKYLVIDGQQRLRSIFNYFEGMYKPTTDKAGTEFRLKGLNERSPFYERAFKALHEEDQRRLKNAVLRAFVVQQLNPDDDTSMYHIFERLNTGGTLLANQEIRNCVYHGTFSDFLKKINRLSQWRTIIGRPQPDVRARDSELILRFLATQDLAGYKEPMKDFLSKFMQKHRHDTEERLEQCRDLFQQTCQSVLDSLGKKPFHIRQGLNAAVFDSVMRAFSKHLNDIPNDIRERYDRLNQDEEFQKNTQGGTTKIPAVTGRVQKAEAVLFGD